MSVISTEDIRALRDEMQATCVGHGDFTLSSGGKSKYYYDGKRRTFHPRWALQLGRVLSDFVLDAEAEAVGGMAVGAVPIAQTISIVILQEHGREVPAFAVRPEAKTHGTKDAVASAYRSDGTPLLGHGTKVAIVDDVVTEGGSVLTAIHEIEQLGCDIVLVAAVVERHEGGGRAIVERGYEFQRVFYTDESGTLKIDESIAQRYSRPSPERVLR